MKQYEIKRFELKEELKCNSELQEEYQVIDHSS